MFNKTNECKELTKLNLEITIKKTGNIRKFKKLLFKLKVVAKLDIDFEWVNRNIYIISNRLIISIKSQLHQPFQFISWNAHQLPSIIAVIPKKTIKIKNFKKFISK